uniref:Uncharacterized protein n=1 Tax=Arundo donax TaxID=35708 RepID=A0A0A9GHB1_ARUDO
MRMCWHKMVVGSHVGFIWLQLVPFSTRGTFRLLVPCVVLWGLFLGLIILAIHLCLLLILSSLMLVINCCPWIATDRCVRFPF